MGSVFNVVYGFSTKHDSGNVRGWGSFDRSEWALTDWIVLGGPVIGFNYGGVND